MCILPAGLWTHVEVPAVARANTLSGSSTGTEKTFLAILLWHMPV